MAIVFDSTLNGDSSNSYVTVAEADQYFENTGYSDWETLSEDQKKVCLINACYYIEANFDFSSNGELVSETQSLSWGRNYAYYPNSCIEISGIPKEVKYAQFELAKRGFELDSSNNVSFVDLQPDTGRAVKKEKVGKLEVEYMDRASSTNENSFNYVNSLLTKLTVGAVGTLVLG